MKLELELEHSAVENKTRMPLVHVAKEPVALVHTSECG